MNGIKGLLFAFVLIICMLFCGCGDSQAASSINVSTKTPEVIYPQEYKTVLEDYKKIVEFRVSKDFEERYNNREFPEISESLRSQINNKSNERLTENWGNMIAEMTAYIENPTVNSFGYVLKDVNSDGLDELFWVDEKRNILAVFTLNNGNYR